MDSYKFNREHSSKFSLLKPKLIFDQVSKQINTNDKKMEKKTMTINKSLTEQQTHQHNRSKSKQKQKNKQNQVSFNDVVNKFKKLFDDKIKFVRDDTMPTTQRIDINKQKKNYGSQIIPQAKVKKVESHTILPKKKNTNNPGFSQILSNIQANLNMGYKLKQKQKINESANNYFKSIDQKNENQQKMPFQIYYKQRLFSHKSKQKINKSKQKVRNISRTLSTKKNKIQRTYQFESVQQQQWKKQIINKQRSKQKNKGQKLSANKLKKNNKNEKSMSNLTYRQRFTSTQMIDDIQQKNKNVLKTLQSQKIGQKKQKLNPSKKTTKNTKLKKNKNKQSKTNLKQKQKIKNKNKTKTKQTQKSKDKFYNGEQISLKPNRIAIKLKANQKIAKFLTNYEKNEEDDKAIKLGEEQIFSNNQHKKVSSSSDLIQQSQQSQLQSLQYFQGTVSDQQNLQKSKKIQNILGSVIQYDVGQQGQLKFHHKIINSDSEQQQQQQVQQIVSATKTWRDDSYGLTSKYLLGFKQYIKYKKVKLLLYQFDQRKIQKKKAQKQQNNYMQKFENTPRKVQQQIEPKIYLKIEQTLKQEQQKWLSLKNNLQRIRKCDNFSQQLQKIIQEAENNHLAFKTMLIKDAKQIQVQKMKESMSNEQQDRSEAQVILKFQTQQVNPLCLEKIKYCQKYKVEIKEQVKQVKKEQYKHQDKGQTQDKQKNNYKQMIKKQQKLKEQQKNNYKQKHEQNQKQIIMHSITTTNIPQISQNIKLIKNYNKIQTAQFTKNQENLLQYLSNNNQICLNSTLKSPPVRHQSINQINININIADADIKINSPFKKNTLQINNEKYTEQNKLNKISIEVINNQKQSILNNNKTIIKKSQTQIQPKKAIEFLEDSLSSSQLSFQAFIEQCQKIQANKKNFIDQNIHITHTKQREGQLEPNKYIKQEQSYAQQDNIKTKRTNMPKLQIPKKSNPKTKLSYEQAPLQIKKILTNKSPSASFEQKYKEKTKKMLISDLNLSQFISNKATDQSRDSSSNLQVKDKNSARVKILQQLRSPIHNSQLHHSINNLFSNSKNKSQQSIHSNTKIQQNNTVNITNKQKISISLLSRDKNQQPSKSYKSQGNLQIITNNNKSKNKNFILFKSKKLSNQQDIFEKQATSYGQNSQKLIQQLTSQNILDNAIKQDYEQQNSYKISHTIIAANKIKQQNIKINKLFQQSNSETLLIQTQYYNHNNNKYIQDNNNKNLSNNDEYGQHEQHNEYNIKNMQDKRDNQQQIKQEQQFIIRQESLQTKLHTILNASNQQIRQHIFQSPSTQSQHNSSQPIYHSPQLQSSNSEPQKFMNIKQRQHILDNPIDMQSYNKQQNTFVKSPKQKYMLDKYYYCYQLINQQLLYQYIGQFAKQTGTGSMKIVKYNRIGDKINQYYNIKNINIIAQQQNNHIKEQSINKIKSNIHYNTATISNTNSNNQLQVGPFTKIKKYANTQQQLQFLQSTHNNNNSDAIHTISYYNPDQNIDINNGQQINDNIITTSIVNSSTMYIIDYVHKLMQYICNDTHRLQQFKRKLSKPIGVSTLMMLQALRQNQNIQQQQHIPNKNCNIKSNNNSNNQMSQDDKIALQLKQCFQADQTANQQQQFQIISLDMHSNFLRETQIQQYDNSNQQMFNHVIYDQINQILNDLRPFGHKGLPIFNFTHKPQNLQVIQSSKNYSPAYIHQYLNKYFNELLNIRLGQYSYDIDSDRNIQRSFNKMIQVFVLYLQQQFRNQNDADFQIKHELLLTLEFIIIQQEVKTIWQVMNTKLGNQ